MNGPRKVHIKSFGCQMNVYDSHRMADTLAPEGFAETATPEDADLVILNTCHIREKAAEKVYSELGRMRVLKQAAARDGRRVVIAVAGCVAQAEGEEIIRRAPAVDLVVGPQSYHRLPALLARVGRGEGVVDTEFPVEDKFDLLAPPSRAATRARGVSAFVTVQEGCDKFCTFCVVPYTRGAEVSRPVAQIVAEVARLADAGVREVTLIGQNVNAYHGDGPDGRPWTLGRLLERVAEVPGIARLRYTTSHPGDMEASLIAAHRDLPSLMPYLHLPVQSGSDRVLAAMNRRHTRADYLDTIARMRATRPDIAFSSDFIVGFPGESDDDFALTLSLVDEVGFAGAFSFKYSPRPGTPGGRDGRAGARGVEIGAALPPAGGDRPPPGRLQCALPRPHLRRAVRKARTPSWPTGRPLPISAAGAGHGRTQHGRGNRRGDDHRDQRQQPVRHACGRTRRGRGRRWPPWRPDTVALAPIGQRIPIAGRRRRSCRNPGRARVRRQPIGLHPVRPVRAEPGADRAPARRGRRAARQSRHHRRLARRLRAGAARARGPLRAAAARRRARVRRRRGRDPAGDRAGLAVRLRPGDDAAELRGDQPAQAPGARPHRRAGRLYPRACGAMRWCSAPARPAPARPGSRSPRRCSCSSARRSTASCSRARRSRPANGSASCPATCARRSIPICARSTTRSTT